MAKGNECDQAGTDLCSGTCGECVLGEKTEKPSMLDKIRGMRTSATLFPVGAIAPEIALTMRVEKHSRPGRRARRALG